MKRKSFAILVLIMVLGVGAFTNVYADPQETGPQIEERIESRFGGVAYVGYGLDISNNVATAYVKITEKSSGLIDYIKVTAKVVDQNGNSVVNWKSDKIIKNSAAQFIFKETCKLTKRGSYKMIFHMDAYKSGSIVDQMDGETDTRTY